MKRMAAYLLGIVVLSACQENRYTFSSQDGYVLTLDTKTGETHIYKSQTPSKLYTVDPVTASRKERTIKVEQE